MGSSASSLGLTRCLAAEEWRSVASGAGVAALDLTVWGGHLGLRRVHGVRGVFKKGLEDGLHLVGDILVEGNNSGSSGREIARKLVLAANSHELHDTRFGYLR